MNQIPEIDPTTGFYPTLNRMGGMSPTLDEFSGAFAQFSAVAPGPVLDVGAAYGTASLAALAAGAQVIANDIEAGHLDILRQRVPQEQQDRLKTMVGPFPDLVWEPASLGGVLLGRMLHFLDGPTIDRGLDLVFNSLRPGGKVFGVLVTPFLAKLAHFRETCYLPAKAAGHPWPGWLERVADYDPEGAASLPTSMNFIDSDCMRAALERAGFRVERLEYFSRQEFNQSMAHDGREALGFIAVK